MTNRNNLYIPSIDAKDLFLTKNIKFGYSIHKKDGKYNLRKFINSFDYSLDLIELRSVAEDVYAGSKNTLSFVVNDKEYSWKVINVTFKYSVKEFNRTGENSYVRFGYHVDESEYIDNYIVKDNQIVAIKTDVPCYKAISKDFLPNYFDVEYDDVTEQYFYRLVKSIPTLFTKTDLRKHLYEHGFTCEKTKFCRFKRSSGSARIGKCLFIDERLYPAMHESEQCGLTYKKDDPIDLAALESYISLTTSSIIDTIEINPENILVIPDYESEFMEDAVCTELNEKNQYVTVQKEMTIKNSIWDGQGLIDRSIMGKYKKKGCLLLRNKFFKSCCFNTNIQKFFKDNGIKSISQIHGITRATSIQEIKLIVTPNSIKYFKFGDFDVWLNHIYKRFGIVKYDKPTHYFDGKYVQAHYQLINTLQLSMEEVENLVKNELDYVDQINTDIDAMRFHLGMKDEDERNNSNIMVDKNEIVYRMLQYDCGFENTKIYTDFRHDLIRSYKNNMKKGHILVNGTYCTLSGNPYEMLLQTIGLFDGTSIIEKGTVYNKRFGDGKELLGSRSPHVTMGNILLTRTKQYDLIDKYFNFTDHIIAINSIGENILERLSGADFDSDQMLVTDNEIMINAARRNYDVFKVPTRNVSPDGTKNRTYSPISMAGLDIDTGTNKIGEIVNLSQEINSLLWDVVHASGKTAAECFDDIKDIYYDACQLDVMSNIEIDKAKKEFSVNNTKELKRLRDKYHDIFTNFDDRMIKPKFLGFIARTKGYYDAKRKVYKHHDTAMDYLYSVITKKLAKHTSFKKNEKISYLFKPVDYNWKFVHISQIEKIKNRIIQFIELSKRIFTFDISKDEKEVMRNFELSVLVSFINELKINDHTMYRLMKDVDGDNNYSFSNLLYYILFNYRNYTVEKYLSKLPLRTRFFTLNDFSIFGQK